MEKQTVVSKQTGDLYELIQAFFHRLWKSTGKFSKQALRWGLIQRGEVIWLVWSRVPAHGIVTPVITSPESHRPESSCCTRPLSCEVGAWLRYLVWNLGLASVWNPLNQHVNIPQSEIRPKGEGSKGWENAQKTVIARNYGMAELSPMIWGWGCGSKVTQEGCWPWNKIRA